MQPFSEPEVKFLLSEHGAEHATHDRKLSAIVDHRLLGCPQEIFFRVCADRAAKLGRKFQEFRASNKSVTTTEVPSLEMQIEASRLF
jgi:hypothetical protein